VGQIDNDNARARDAFATFSARRDLCPWHLQRLQMMSNPHELIREASTAALRA
jgi:hypothetical protein